MGLRSRMDMWSPCRKFFKQGTLAWSCTFQPSGWCDWMFKCDIKPCSRILDTEVHELECWDELIHHIWIVVADVDLKRMNDVFFIKVSSTWWSQMFGLTEAVDKDMYLKFHVKLATHKNLLPHCFLVGSTIVYTVFHGRRSMKREYGLWYCKRALWEVCHHQHRASDVWSSHLRLFRT